MISRVAVFCSSRADFSPLLPVVAELTRRGVHVDAMLSGTTSVDDVARARSVADNAHLSVRHEPNATASSAAAALVPAIGEVARPVAQVLENNGAQLLLLLGDRWELLPAATAAVLLGVPIVHLHGGEITEGAIDERVRHAITKLADVHLCSTVEAAARVIQMGEQPHRTHVVGAPGLDNLVGVVAMTDDEIATILGPWSRPLALVTYHPVTTNLSGTLVIAETVLRVAARRCGAVVVTAPGRDPGADEARQAAETAAQIYRNVAFVTSLGEDYPRFMAAADVMIGNTSSGIIEAASFGLPVVDVGERQRGRERPRNVIHTQATEVEISDAVERALSPAFRSNLRGMANPYGDGHSAARIAEIIRTLDRSALTQKTFHPTAEGSADRG